MIKTICEQIKAELTIYLDSLKDDYVEEGFSYEIKESWCREDIYLFEVLGYYKNECKPDEKTEYIMLRLYLNCNYKQFQISNIFLPIFMRHKSIGKTIIHKIFLVAEKEQYELYIVDMVKSFYKRMIARGALPCADCDDAVKIDKIGSEKRTV